MDRLTAAALGQPLPPKPAKLFGACKVCNGITFHVLVPPPAPGALVRQALALECTNCEACITLEGPQ